MKLRVTPEHALQYCELRRSFSCLLGLVFVAGVYSLGEVSGQAGGIYSLLVLIGSVFIGFTNKNLLEKMFIS